jgi:hypothetical protein
MSSTSTRRPETTGWVGWVAFAGLMMMINGAMNAIAGIAAIANDTVYVAGARATVVLNLTAFGWIHLVLGLGVAAAGFFLLQGATWAAFVAIGVTTLNMLTQMLMLPAYPFWSLLIIAVDVLVLWALMMHSDELRRA